MEHIYVVFLFSMLAYDIRNYGFHGVKELP